MIPARINLHRGCTHAYVSKKNSSKRTRAAKAVLQDQMKCAQRRAETKFKRRRGTQKQRKIDDLTTLKVSKSMCVSETTCDSSHIFYAPKGVDVLPQKKDDLQRKSRLQRDVTSLEVIDTTDGCTLSGDDGIPIFTLIPRHVVLSCSGDTKAAELKLLKRLSKDTKQTTRGNDREGETTNTKSHYRCVGNQPQRGRHGLLETKIKNDKGRHTWNGIKKMVKRVEHISIQYLSSPLLPGLVKARNAVPWRTFGDSSICASIAHSQDYSSAAHTDPDFFMSMFLTYVDDDEKLSLECEKHIHFCFPTVGYAVALRDGDVLLFNPLYHHCCSQKEKGTKTVHVCSFYLKTGVVGGNDNRIELTEFQKQLLL